MNVSPIYNPGYNEHFGTRAGAAPVAQVDAPKAPRFGEVMPPNGNPGIVPPWLQGNDARITPMLIGIAPVDPDVPVIM